MTSDQIENRLKILTAAYNMQCSHIPSALSMIDYLSVLQQYINFSTDAFIIGKPYGQLAYYVAFNYNITDQIITGNSLNITWADTTIGNSLGIAYGLALSNVYKNIFINTSDASLQEGTMLEAMLKIGFSRIKSKIILLVDYNSIQCISSNTISINQMMNIFKSFNWRVHIIDGHDTYKINNAFLKLNTYSNTTPICYLFKTIKGYGVKFMEDNPIQWHYKKLTANLYKYSYEELNAARNR